MRRPIEIWPPRPRPRGRPGYSGKHFAMVSPADDDPLRVAERIAAQADSAAIAAECQQRLAAGGEAGEVLAWQTAEQNARSQARWQRLCDSLSDVIAALESAPQTPVLRRLIRAARKAATQP